MKITNEMISLAAEELLAHGEFGITEGANRANVVIAARAALTAALQSAADTPAPRTTGDPDTDSFLDAFQDFRAENKRRESELHAPAPPPPQTHMMGGGIAASIKQAVGECLAGMLSSEVSKDARRKIEKAIDLASVPKPAWLDMASAPKDGTMLRLLVLPDQEEFTAFDDSLTPYETIGSNGLADTGEDRWEFAGWDWQQDCFITGRGEVIGWSPFMAAEMSQIEAAVRWCLDRDQLNGSLPEAYAERLRAALAASPAPQTREAGISPLSPSKVEEE